MLRDHWRAKLTQWTASQLVFIDESAVNERTMDRKTGWAPIGVPAVDIRSIKRTKRWSILPAYTVDGYLTWDLIQDSYKADTFEDFIQNKVLPLCTPYPGPRSILIMDNAKIHRREVHSIDNNVLHC